MICGLGDLIGAICVRPVADMVVDHTIQDKCQDLGALEGRCIVEDKCTATRATGALDSRICPARYPDLKER